MKERKVYRNWLKCPVCNYRDASPNVFKSEAQYIKKLEDKQIICTGCGQKDMFIIGQSTKKAT